MPTDNPQVGEVWFLPDFHTLTDSHTYAVVGELLGDQIRLIARTGRRVVVGRRSFEKVWRLERLAPPAAWCSQEGCRNKPCCRFGAWFCAEHAPRHVPLGLPGDPEDNPLPLLGDFDLCPVCKVPKNEEWQQRISSMSYVLGCPDCRANWIAQLPGPSIVEDVLAAKNTLERDMCENLSVRVGESAYEAIRRQLSTLFNSKDTTLVGLPLIKDYRQNTDVMLICGTGSGQPIPTDELTVGEECTEGSKLYRVETLTSKMAGLLDCSSGKTVAVSRSKLRLHYGRVSKKSVFERLLEKSMV